MKILDSCFHRNDKIEGFPETFNRNLDIALEIPDDKLSGNYSKIKTIERQLKVKNWK